ncbi:MAG: cytochrome b5 domain-containing protein [Mobilitalea sp.]
MKKTILLVLTALIFFTGSSLNPEEENSTGHREFTLEELKTYNGQNGNPAYIAVDGVVYDVTNSIFWQNGAHSFCSDNILAGNDLSELINASPHGKEVLERLPVVGYLKE